MTDARRVRTYAEVVGRELLLDLHLPEQGGKPRLVVWVHGGAWQTGSRDDLRLDLTEAGFAMASIDFRQAGEAPFPAQVHDIKAAIRYLRAHAEEYGYDAERIAVAGYSSGGHLAAIIGTTNGNDVTEGAIGEYPGADSSVQAIIDFFGPTNLFTIIEQSTPRGLDVRLPALKLLLGESVQGSGLDDLAMLASPVHQVSAEAPPILIMHGVQDNQVPVNQSIELHQVYQARGLDSQLVLVPGAGHEDEIYYRGEYREVIVGFLNRVLDDMGQ